MNAFQTTQLQPLVTLCGDTALESQTDAALSSAGRDRFAHPNLGLTIRSAIFSSP
jgi:hypothetical protein